jgi:hypothetical protein
MFLLRGWQQLFDFLFSPSPFFFQLKTKKQCAAGALVPQKL